MDVDPLKPGDHLVVLTGAGISADSGLATFRGGGGLWEGQRVEDVATPEAWDRQPEDVWRFYQMRRQALGSAEPNPGHTALADLEKHLIRIGAGFTLITQNVDDLHQRAGSKTLAMHGELLALRCEECGGVIRDGQQLDETRFVPCPACEHPRLRPDIVWFGEIPYHLDAIGGAMGQATHFLASGTSGAVWPAAGLLHQARVQEAQTFVNALAAPENLDSGDTFLEGHAAEVLPRLVQAWMGTA